MTGGQLKAELAHYHIPQIDVAGEAGVAVSTICRQLSGERPLNDATIRAARRLIHLRRREQQVAIGRALLTGDIQEVSISE